MANDKSIKRLTYSPKVNVVIKADTGIYDISEYVTECQVNRKVNEVSSASVSFRNPDRIFTNGENGPIFHPMDPITIYMTRIDNKPVQVFTGYCDSTPYYQLRPGIAQITASCTLKRLLYTFWDPGLPFVEKVLTDRGWISASDGSGGAYLTNRDAETGDLPDDPDTAQEDQNLEGVSDSSIGALLFDVMRYIGKWNEEDIYIEKIPSSVYESAENLLIDINESNKKGIEEFSRLMKRIIGENALGSGGNLGNTGGAGPEPFAKVTPVEVGRAMLTVGFPNDESIIAEGINVVKGESDFGNYEPWKELNSAGCVGYWQHQIAPPDGSWEGHDISLEDACTLVPSTTLTKQMWQDSGNSFQTHWYNWNGGGYSKDASTYLQQAKNAIELGPFTENNGQSNPQPTASGAGAGQSPPNSSGAGQPGSNTG